MQYLRKRRKWGHIIVAPIVASLVIPLVIFDIWAEIYYRICFLFCKIPYVARKKFNKIDRQKLSYLNIMQKFFCIYCGYANGLINYWQEIAGQTKFYWCGIKHNKDRNFIEPEHHKQFSKYGDEQEFKQKYKF